MYLDKREGPDTRYEGDQGFRELSCDWFLRGRLLIGTHIYDLCAAWPEYSFDLN